MGDFYQFSPVKGLSLWRSPRADNDEECSGRDIWHQFTEVVLLDEQMRQSEDPVFRDLLAQTRSGKLSEKDVDFLNSKTVSLLDAFVFDDMVAIVRSNILRHSVNHIVCSTPRSACLHLPGFPPQASFTGTSPT